MDARRLIGAAASMALAAATVFAQERTTPAAGTITLVGCVERADQVLARENLGTTVDSLTFVLMNAQQGKASDQPATEPSSDSREKVGKMYRLDADEDTINPHVGHRVEVTGTIPEAPVGTSGRAEGQPGAAGPPPTMKVESVKMLSSTCAR